MPGNTGREAAMPGHDACVQQLAALYRPQLEALEATGRQWAAGYLEAHSGLVGAVDRQVWIARRYLPHVRGRLLDWGCMHAPDACLVRMLAPDVGPLHGCDVFDPGTFQVFHDFAGLAYRQVEHPWRLPYPDEYFDTVIADGVLEHVPIDGQSLVELYRVLRPGGRLIVCALPNAWSYTEWLARWTGRPHHLRTYTLAAAKLALLHHGLLPLQAGRYQMVPTLSGRRLSPRLSWLAPLFNALWKASPLLEWCWPVNRLASNLFLVAEKCHAITWRPRPLWSAAA
jgi:SAM-dependent methyltransferase